MGLTLAGYRKVPLNEPKKQMTQRPTNDNTYDKELVSGTDYKKKYAKINIDPNNELDINKN